MAELEHHQKEQIVVLLAKFRSPSEIAALLKDETGIDLTVQQISKYDPSRAAFDAGQRWRPIFEAARKQYLIASTTSPSRTKVIDFSSSKRLRMPLDARAIGN